MITVKYFGPLADELGLSEEQLSWEGGSTEDLLRQLRARGGCWEASLAPGKIYRMAVEQEICHKETGIPDGAEVGILPPVTGG